MFLAALHVSPAFVLNVLTLLLQLSDASVVTAQV